MCFDNFDRPLGLIRKINDGSIDLEICRSNASETTREKWEHKSKEQKNTINNLEMFYKAREKLSSCLMMILQLYLRINIKQNMEKDSKY